MRSVPGVRRRAAAAFTLVLTAVAVVLMAFGIGVQVGRLLAALVLLVLATIAAWYTVTRAGWRRAVGSAVFVATLAVLAIVTLLGERTNATVTVAGIALFVAAQALGRWALGRDLRTLKSEPPSGTPVAAAAHPVLLINPRSGGGKADRFALVRACLERGIEPAVMSSNDDLALLARDAIQRGADVVGMAGGDGSQAVVASIAASCGVAMVVVPAGTRNHLALDLGLDTDDLIGALDAFGEAVERDIDLGDVNGRAFVNNVSLGVYASIVRSPEYRDAKVETTLATLPMVLGPGAAPFDLSFGGPDGRTHLGARLVQVSNNPYASTLLAVPSRPRLDTHRLGVIALEIDDDGSGIRFLSALAQGHPERFDGFAAWTPATFEVSSAGAVDVGLDGEPLRMDAPLCFSIRPEPLRVRLPFHAIGESPAGRRPNARSVAVGLWRIALGRPAVAT